MKQKSHFHSRPFEGGSLTPYCATRFGAWLGLFFVHNSLLPKFFLFFSCSSRTS